MISKIKIILSIVLALVVFLPTYNFAKDYQFMNQYKLSIDVPPNWKEVAKYPEQNLPPNIELTSPDNNLTLLITPLPNLKKLGKVDLKRMCHEMGQKYVKDSIEKKLTIKQFSGKNIFGYFYTFEEQNGSGFPIMTQFTAKTKTLILSVTILSNDRQSTDYHKAFEVIKNISE